MNLETAIRHGKSGNALLFTGAGYSFGAENSVEGQNGIPTAKALSKILADLSGQDGDYQLTHISQFFMKEKSKEDLIGLLLSYFTIVNVAEHHKILGSIPWSRVYTTNYDDCFEHSSRLTGLDFQPITTDAHPSASEKRCVHINGHISNLTASSLDSQIKLTHSSYSSEDFSNNSWALRLRQDMSYAKAIFFVGYSLADLDVSRILYANPDLIDRTFFITSPDDDPVSTSVLEEYGQVESIGIRLLAEMFESQEYVITSESEHELGWLTEYLIPTNPKRPNDVSSHNLIFKGEIESAMVAYSIGEPTAHYTVNREEISSLVTEINNSRKWHIVHGDLGTGKTVFKEQASFALVQQGYRVFWDSDFDFQKSEDLDYLSSLNDKAVIFIEAEHNKFNAISLLKSVDMQNVCFVFIMRTVLYELAEKSLIAEMDESFAEYDLNILQDTEIEYLIETFNTRGLWSGYTNSVKSDKIGFCRQKCDRSLQRIILSLYENSKIGINIVKEAEVIINSDPEISDLLITSFLITKLQKTPRLRLISNMLPKFDVWKLVKSDKFRAIDEFVRFKHGLVSARSPILASVLLKNAVEPEKLVKLILRIVGSLAAKHRSDDLQHIYENLMKFSFLDGVIEHKKKRQLIVGLYESAKDDPAVSDNADFWLQYAVARLTFEQYGMVETYFDSALSLASGNTKKTVDIENHISRFLLESRMKSNNYPDFFAAFSRAHEIIMDQINRNNNEYFPYKQARQYLQYITFRGIEFTSEELDRFNAACNEIKASASAFRSQPRGRRILRECVFNMDRAIEIASKFC